LQDELTRRSFIKKSAVLASGWGLAANGLSSPPKYKPVEARYYQKLENKTIQCNLCPWQCVVESGKLGHCRVRKNINGTYYSLVYGRIAAQHNDPIEKKPFYHFLPTTNAFSIATAGCNVSCKFCQNWELAHRDPDEIFFAVLKPEEIVRLAKQQNSRSIAYTYNEPTIFTEFMLDTSMMAKEQGIRNVVKSNGFINKKPLLDLCKVLDAYSVDLKAFTQKYYSDLVGGRLAPVLDSLVTLKSQDVWTEIVYLVVPTLNDDEKEIRDMVQWIRKELGEDVPLHFSRFYPKYRLRNLPPTPVTTLEKCRQIALDSGLHYVYMGNVPGHSGGNTTCPNCKKMILGRVGYQVFENHINQGTCEFCGTPIAGVWK